MYSHANCDISAMQFEKMPSLVPTLNMPIEKEVARPLEIRKTLLERRKSILMRSTSSSSTSSSDSPTTSPKGIDSEEPIYIRYCKSRRAASKTSQSSPPSANDSSAKASNDSDDSDDSDDTKSLSTTQTSSPSDSYPPPVITPPPLPSNPGPFSLYSNFYLTLPNGNYVLRYRTADRKAFGTEDIEGHLI